MRWRGVLVGGLATCAWIGCAAVAGLDDFEIVDLPDASPDSRAQNEAATPAPVVDSGGAVDAASPDAGPIEAGPIDAGPCGACPRGTVRALCVENACAATYRVFVTNAGFDANFGSATGGDVKCQAAATAAHLGGTWMAWLSDASSSPSTRFTRAPVLPLRLLDGTIVAVSNIGLLTMAPQLQHPIDLDEMDASPITLEVWTGTDPSAAKASTACAAWTSTSSKDTGIVGIDTYVDGGWTDAYQQTCDRAVQHLYCLEQ